MDKILDEAYKLYMPQHRDEIQGLAEFIKKHNPKITVEIGSKFGGTFMIWNEVFDGIKISVDLVAGIHGGITREETDKRNDLFNSKYNDCVFIEGNSHEQSTYDKLVEVLDGKEVDFMFIDGDHTYEGVKQDFKMYSPLVKKGGHVAFHDINDTEYHRGRNVFVEQLWTELEGDKIEFNVNEEWGGIGVISV
jgi:cephalosporin hydroxylase